MTPDLKILADNRDALLLAEVGAWLHMLGKFHEDFLNGDNTLDIKIPQDLNQKYPLLCSLLTQPWTGQIWHQLGVAELDAEQMSIYELIKEHKNKNAPTGLERLMWDAHGRGSGIEKGLLNRFALPQKNCVYLSTAFGFEEGPIDLQDISNKRNILYKDLQTQLKELKKTSGQHLTEWRGFRHSLISIFTKLFSLTVADTRRPFNDISLFDQTVASVAFLKSSLAQILLQGWKDPNTKSITDKYHWRILRVGFNGVAFWTKSSRISDIDARKRLIPPLLDEIRNLIEIDYPLGYEIYRDEMGSVFILPDVNGLLNATLGDGKNLSEKISELSRNHLNIEANIYLYPISHQTRNMQSFGQLMNETLPEPFPDNELLTDIQKVWSQQNEVCVVCGLRPQGPNKKSLSRDVCDICEKRRLDRSKDWCGKLNYTIWIDEVADINGRIALIVGTFDLKDWLNGMLVSSIVAFDPSKRQLTDTGRNGKQYPFDYSELLEDIEKRLKNPKQTLGGGTLVDNLILKNRRDSAVSDKFGDIYDLYISDSDLNNQQKEAWRFALAMIRQQPSPARIRRIWETTKKFWEDVEQDFKETVGSVDGRLEIIGEFKPKNESNHLMNYNSYEAELEGVRFTIFYVNDDKYIIIENLKRLAKKMGASSEESDRFKETIGYIKKRFKNKDKPLNIYDTEGENREKPIGLLEVSKVEDEFTSYTPTISILSEPSVFMAIVPAGRALEIAKHIKEKYETEMGKVRNRLPLTMGVVFAKSHTPLVALMDAGRRMLNVDNKEEDWTLTENAHDYGMDCTLNFENKIIWHVPIKMGDDVTEDVWYPYFYVNGVPKGRSRAFKCPKGWLVRVTELKKGDKVKITPSRFDFEFLDTSSRRFEVSYKNGKRRDPVKSTRPYLLEELDDFKELWDVLWKGLARSQIKNVIELIETKREEWLPEDGNDVFEKFVHDVLRNANWKNEMPSNIGELENAAISGKLRDIVELYMDILKIKEEKQEEGSK